MQDSFVVPCHLCVVFMQVLQSCHDYPGVVEIMVNSYAHLKPTKKWSAAIPDDCYKVVHGCNG